jgi:hypothetical protein
VGERPGSQLYRDASSATSDKRQIPNFPDDIRKILARSAVIAKPTPLFIGTRKYLLWPGRFRAPQGARYRRTETVGTRSSAAIRRFSETISNYRSQESQLSLARAAASLAWASVLLAVVALIIGAIQIYLAIVT